MDVPAARPARSADVCHSKDFQGVNEGTSSICTSVPADPRRWTRRRASCSGPGHPPKRPGGAAPARCTLGRRCGSIPRVVVGAVNLAESIRRYGHLAARIDPLGSRPVGDPTLVARDARRDRGRTQARAGLARRRTCGRGCDVDVGCGRAAARDLLRDDGYDMAHIFEPEERQWLREAIETRPLPRADRSDRSGGAARSADRRRGVRAIPAPHVPGQDAVLDRRARHARADPRRGAVGGGRSRACGRRSSAWRIAAA